VYVECSFAGPGTGDTGGGRPDGLASGAVRSIAATGFLLLACLGGGCRETPLVPARRAPAASAEWWNGAVVYEVFVRSFLDSDGNGSGDIAGLIARSWII